MGTPHDQRWFDQSSFKFANGASVASVRNAQPYVDRGGVWARAIISTATEDRVGDILNPRGCQLKNYSLNPVVMWGHGLEGITTPIGTSIDPMGNLTVEVNDDYVLATSYFAQNSKEAMDIFGLICDGVVRATSVRETPIVFRKSWNDGRQVTKVDKWDLEEWSWCAIGVNPDAVAKAMQTKYDGRQLSPSIMKSLNAVMPAKRVQGRGMGTTMKKDDEKEMSDDEMPAEDVQETGNDMGEEDSSQQPYGAQMIAAYHAMMSAANRQAEKGMGAMEHPEATPAMRMALDSVKDAMTGLKGAYSSCYPKSQLKMMDEDEVDDMTEDEAEAERKAWMAKGCNSLTLRGAAQSLKSLVGARNLTPSQRAIVNELQSGFARWGAQAKSLRMPQQRNMTAEQQAALDAAFAKLTAKS